LARVSEFNAKLNL